MKNSKYKFDALKECFLKNKIFILGVFLILFFGVISLPRIFADPQPVKSVEIF